MLKGKPLQSFIPVVISTKEKSVVFMDGFFTTLLNYVRKPLVYVQNDS